MHRKYLLYYLRIPVVKSTWYTRLYFFQASEHSILHETIGYRSATGFGQTCRSRVTAIREFMFCSREEGLMCTARITVYYGWVVRRGRISRTRTKPNQKSIWVPVILCSLKTITDRESHHRGTSALVKYRLHILYSLV